ncbi:hypothetical protein A2716_00420 [candidate division WWE3 bacterium RIFCSPHIGHO2_01_FULL_40_23]|uniref:Uncharacterized protein n=1 Tax=candidate division WWE3 bacterium RIFCSPLOWO2_01_FULL_41_18 TaxID=1802625 RepID=A0A1F4VEV0_UNCKA|nr:MAG: hypothetical protein A2716_00420 [candidate division WWE3 bacterium RIFCSPHIGHO2_01_FULL_40_23]OGC55460.1 MAG: hypothetical protein A3A78_00690 [candidate division WWE3 bacterium RIFCSPLOWO2_01_FULL_41_18]
MLAQELGRRKLSSKEVVATAVATKNIILYYRAIKGDDKMSQRRSQIPFAVLAGVIGVALSFLLRDLVAANPEMVPNVQPMLVGGIVGGLVSLLIFAFYTLI